jgi:Flp pilus assembly protein TadD
MNMNLKILGLILGCCLLAKSVMADTGSVPASLTALLDSGYQALNKGRFTEAQSRFEEAAGTNAQSGDPWVGLGYVALRQGQYDEAAARFEKALAVTPNLEKALVGLGYVALERGRFDEARARFIQAHESSPQSEQPWIGLGYADLKTAAQDGKNLDKALSEFDQALAINPEATEALIGKLYA